MIIHNRFIPFRKFDAVNILGIIFVRRGVKLDDTMINHERIHTSQQREMLYVFFFLWYIIEWLVRLAIYRSAMKAYRAISFEQEAYHHMRNLTYLSRRKHFAWRRYL